LRNAVGAGKTHEKRMKQKSATETKQTSSRDLQIVTEAALSQN